MTPKQSAMVRRIFRF